MVRTKRTVVSSILSFMSITILVSSCINPKAAPPANSDANGKSIINPPFSSSDSARAIEGIPRVDCYMHQEKAFCVSNENIMVHDDPAVESYFVGLEEARDIALHCGANTFYFPFDRIDSNEFSHAFLANEDVDGFNPGFNDHGTNSIAPGEHFFADLTIPEFQSKCPQGNQVLFEDRDSEINLYAQSGNKEIFLEFLDQLNGLTGISDETEAAIDEMEGRVAEYCEEMRGDYHPETGNPGVVAATGKAALEKAVQDAIVAGSVKAMEVQIGKSTEPPKWVVANRTSYATQSSSLQVVKVYFLVKEDDYVFDNYYDFFFVAEFPRNGEGELITDSPDFYFLCDDCPIEIEQALVKQGEEAAKAEANDMNEALNESNASHSVIRPPDEREPGEGEPDKECEEGECSATSCEQMATWWTFNKEYCALSGWNTYECQRLLGFPNSCGFDPAVTDPGPDGWQCREYQHIGAPKLTEQQECQLNKRCSLDDPNCCQAYTLIEPGQVITPIERGGGVCGDPHAYCPEGGPGTIPNEPDEPRGPGDPFFP